MPGRTVVFGAQYRFGFNGKENDNDVKGPGNQQDYGMRIYDPRMGRFLSVDPISKQFPELTPYQFASNRPIDGIDLDGMEYLRANEALVEVNNGDVFIKVANLQTGVKFAFQEANRAAGGTRIFYDKLGRQSITNAISTKIGSVNFSNAQAAFQISSKNIFSGLIRNPSPQNPDDHLPMADAPIATSRIPISYDPISNIPRDLPYSTPSAGMKTAARGTLLVNVAVAGVERIQNWLVNSEQDNIQHQADKFLPKAYSDLLRGIEQKMVPSKYNNARDLSNILNVILSGTNNSENKQLTEIGLQIYNKFKSIRIDPARGLDHMQNQNPKVTSQPKPPPAD